MSLWYLFQWRETEKWDASELEWKRRYTNQRRTKSERYQYDYEPNRPEKVSSFIKTSRVVEAKTKEEALSHVRD